MDYEFNSPHGGKLINRLALDDEKEELQKKAQGLKKISLTRRLISDVEMIAVGAFSPLEGFMTKKDYISVIKKRCFASGYIWTIPITLAVSKEEASQLKEKEDVALLDSANEVTAILHLEEKFTYDKRKEAEAIYRTDDASHPGVAYLYKRGGVYLGGEVTVLRRMEYGNLSQYRLDPHQTRELFKKKGWRRIVGFQTRNPIHRAHEFIIKCAMEITDGLLLNPLAGVTKKGDIPADIRMRCYEVLIDKYFPQQRVVMAIMGASMRYAGPNEAVFHALIRKNFGCTHFIVGRDHAGVGKFYGTFDAQKIFDEFKQEQLGIIPLFFDHAFYCRRCGELASVKTCPHPSSEHISFSGTKVRELLRAGEFPPQEFSRREVADILMKAYREGII